MSLIRAPFSVDDVRGLNSYQTSGIFHPYTCARRNEHPPDALLVATVRGWICPYCDYTQDWAHEVPERIGSGAVSLDEAVTLPLKEPLEVDRRGTSVLGPLANSPKRGPRDGE